jgi:hypothetical protein
VDEYTWIAIVRDNPGRSFVPIGNRAEYHHGVRKGAILRFDIQQGRKDHTSVQYEANVFSEDPMTGQKESVFAASTTHNPNPDKASFSKSLGSCRAPKEVPLGYALIRIICGALNEALSGLDSMSVWTKRGARSLFSPSVSSANTMIALDRRSDADLQLSKFLSRTVSAARGQVQP